MDKNRVVLISKSKVTVIFRRKMELHDIGQIVSFQLNRGLW